MTDKRFEEKQLRELQIHNRFLETELNTSNFTGFFCPNCNRVYKYRKNLVQHLRLECGVPPQFKCPYCHYRGKTKYSLKSHMGIKHFKFDNLVAANKKN